ncbi:phospholipase D family protein [Paenibacillus dokdonensis]|uniref:Phospholipase D family protein n=1 Tax=Paenibacillus dokdonensis TaxID=2567944 RepID=A0ABU6GQI9_9BACL|nr:phospholipase D family protein [Paenibacillus dokdonensis]MEC0242029.1 phospholipase D family protein [Paenibacillus dokdonensis]
MGQDTDQQSRYYRAAAASEADLINKPKPRKRRKRRWVFSVLALLVLWLAGVIVYQTHKPLPPGISYESPLYHVKQVRFLHDLTYPDPSGKVVSEQQILQRIDEIVDNSRKFLVIDLFLFNNYTHKGQEFPKISQGLTDKLVQHKKTYPDMDIVFITDDVNTNYGSASNPLLEQMKSAGIRVIVTNVDPLRDSNPIYSSVWRTFFQWFGQSGKGWLPNLMASDGPKMTVRSYLKLVNVKANHRKVVVSENTALVSSGNVHDASAYHSNVAFEVQGPIIKDILASEQAAADLSNGGQLPQYIPDENAKIKANDGPIGVRYLTEGKVYKYVLQEIDATKKGDTLWMGMFYIADEKVMNALLSAADRGVEIRLLLDPNENAFGQEKIGIPNRPVAAELTKRSKERIAIRWYHTTAEQFHTKMMYIHKPDAQSIIMGGSTNMTPRNLDNYNLENELWVSVPSGAALDLQMESYFDRLWNNKGGSFSLDLSAYQEKSTWFKDMLFRIQKALGFTTF